MPFFDAAARSQSFKIAAKELRVTGPAVAQRIRRLESHLGYVLFERRHRRVLLNSRGRAFHQDIKELLDDIIGVTKRYRSSGRRLTIVSVESVAERLLMPRLAEFRAMHPDIVIELETNHHAVSPADRDFDAWIDYRARDPMLHGLQTQPLFEARLFPVCSPGFLEEHGHPVALRDLKDLPLLVNLGSDPDWRDWFASQGEPVPDLSAAWAFRLFSMVVDAAVAGMGVALGHDVLIARELATHRLVPLLPDHEPTTTTCALVTTATEDEPSGMPELRHWLRGLAHCATG